MCALVSQSGYGFMMHSGTRTFHEFRAAQQNRNTQSRRVEGLTLKPGWVGGGGHTRTHTHTQTQTHNDNNNKEYP